MQHDPRPQLEAYPPRSDVATRRQVVPCLQCDQPILVPFGRDAREGVWRAVHTDTSDPYYRRWHYAAATPIRYAADGEVFTIWVPGS